MKFLAAKGFRVLPLSKALELLDKKKLPVKSVVVTIDDGFAGVYKRALPILTRFGFPATTYVTTYNVLKGTPVFRLLIQYLFWKTKSEDVEVDGLNNTRATLPLRTESERDYASDLVMEYGESQLEEPARVSLARQLAARLGLDYESIVQRRLLGLMTPDEIRSAVASGMDIQLHTHRHRLPMSSELVAREIKDNRDFLEPVVGRRLHHLCYPSGIWAREQWPWLASLGIESATTCVPGLNDAYTPRHGLRRFLDGENVRPIEFEAELYGFTILMREARNWLRRLFRNEEPRGVSGAATRLAPD